MIRKDVICPNCNGARHLSFEAHLLNESEYQRKLKCRKCDTEWWENYPLVSDSNAYVYLWDNDRKISIPLHRWVWEQYHGTKLTLQDAIHHLNRNKGDDRPSNLERMSRDDHNGTFHKTEIICKKCGHTWLPRSFSVRMCPRCKSTYWNK